MFVACSCHGSGTSEHDRRRRSARAGAGASDGTERRCPVRRSACSSGPGKPRSRDRRRLCRVRRASTRGARRVGRSCVLPGRRCRLVTGVPERGEICGASFRTSVDGQSSCCRETRRSRGCVGRWSGRARRRFALCQARSFSSRATTPCHVGLPSTWTRWRVSALAFSSNGSVGSVTPAWKRSAKPWPSPSTANAEEARPPFRAASYDTSSGVNPTPALHHMIHAGDVAASEKGPQWALRKVRASANSDAPLFGERLRARTGCSGRAALGGTYSAR